MLSATFRFLPQRLALARHGEVVFRPQHDVTVALTHYAPVDDTLAGEPPEIWAFLGNYLLGEVIDDAGADLAVHGHAHAGTEKGITDGGVRVRNVAQPVIRAPYAVYDLHPRARSDGGTASSSSVVVPGRG